MYTEEFIDELMDAHNGVKTEKDLPALAKAFVRVLRSSRADITRFYDYGPYWWAVKALIKKHTTGDDWFYGDYFDSLTLERAWHGTELRTIAAAVNHSNQAEMTTNHHFILIDGEEVPYTLYDQDSGIEGTLAYQPHER